MKNRICLIATAVALALAAPVSFGGDLPTESVSGSPPATAGDQIDSRGLTLDQAIAMAHRLNPSLQAFTHGVSTARARLDQAGLYANPDLGLEVENFAGDGELDGFDGAETTLVLSQQILLGGKVAGRRGVAESNLALANRDLDAVRLDVAAITTVAFYGVIAAQERVDLTEELAALATSFADTVGARVEAGKVSPVEGIRARAALAQARVEVAKARRALNAARVVLATTWGSSDPQFGRAIGELPPPSAPPANGALDDMLMQTPEMARLAEELERQERLIRLEKAGGVPDLTVSVGPREFQDTGNRAWVGGVSLPLPIFDRNQGARRAAEFELERTRREVEGKRIALEGRLSRTLETLRAAADVARSYERDIVPASTEAFEAISLGFREGKFGFLEVLDAQRSLFEARLLLLDSRQLYAEVRVELDRLVGRPLGKAADAPSAPQTEGESQ